MEYKFGLRGHDIADNFTDMCENARIKGINKLQLAMAKTVKDVDFDELGYNVEFSEKIRKGLQEYNLHVSVLGCYINPVSQDKEFLAAQLTRFKNFLYYAKDFGADVIGTETGGGTVEQARTEERYRYFINNMEPIIREAERIGVTVGIEPVYNGTIYNPQIMKQMLDEINSPALGVILDISNLTVAETRHMQKDMINDSFDLFGDKIKAIHLKDFSFCGNKKSFAVAGRGELMTELIFERIRKLSRAPEIILDETPISLYEESVVSLGKLLDLWRD